MRILTAIAFLTSAAACFTTPKGATYQALAQTGTRETDLPASHILEGHYLAYLKVGISHIAFPASAFPDNKARTCVIARDNVNSGGGTDCGNIQSIATVNLGCFETSAQ